VLGTHVARWSGCRWWLLGFFGARRVCVCVGVGVGAVHVGGVGCLGIVLLLVGCRVWVFVGWMVFLG
jgi:uncharacterized membrane protein